MAEMMGVDKVQVRSTYVLMSCPFSKVTHEKATDRHPSLSVVLGPRSHWRCFACGQRGIMYGLAYQWGHQEKKDPAPLLDLIDAEENSLTAVCTRLDQGFEDRWKGWQPQSEAAADKVNFDVFEEVELEPFIGRVPQYILDRGISIETCKEWQLGLDKDWRDFDTKVVWPRLVFPVRRKDGKLVGMIGRALEDGAPHKYYNYWNFTKTSHLYGLDKVKDRDWVIVVEGMIDVLKFSEYRLPVVGTMGALPSERQALLLQEFGRVCLALDRDKAGVEGERWMTRRLEGRVPVFTVPFPDGKTDPKQFTMEEAWTAVENMKRIL